MSGSIWPWRSGGHPASGLPSWARDGELDRIQNALDQAISGQGRVLAVSGEPGIGKTRLVEELAALAEDQGALVGWGRLDDIDGAPPYWAWIQLLDAMLDNSDRDVIGQSPAAHAGPIAAILPGERARHLHHLGGHVAEARASYARAERELVGAFGPDHHEVGVVLANRAALEAEVGDPQVALGPDHADVIHVRSNLRVLLADSQ